MYYNQLRSKCYKRCLRILPSYSKSSTQKEQNWHHIHTFNKNASNLTIKREEILLPKYIRQKKESITTISEVEVPNSSEDKRNNNRDLLKTSNFHETKSKESVQFVSDVSKFKPFHQINSRKPSTFLFPSEDSLFIGMGKKLLDYPLVKDMYEIASEILKRDLKKICFEGPKSELYKMTNCQPAVLVTSLAALQKLKNEKPQAIENCMFVAGFGVGELSALVCAEWISFENAVQFVKVRSEAMQAAVNNIESGKMLIGCSSEPQIYSACVDAKDWCKKLGIEQPECSIAGYLYHGYKIIAGNEEALQFIQQNGPEYGIKLCRHMKIGGASYTNLMLSAEGPIRKALDDIKINTTKIAVRSTVDGKQYTSAKQVCKNLIMQISSAVKWDKILKSFYPSSRSKSITFPVIYECGPGGRIKSIFKHINYRAFESCESLDV